MGTPVIQDTERVRAAQSRPKDCYGHGACAPVINYHSAAMMPWHSSERPTVFKNDFNRL